jgi:hypothetical protein
MIPNLSEAGRKAVEDVAQRHGVSPDAVATLLTALVAGHGSQAQFNHPDLGGMGQWSPGGMIMVGDMFNHGLKARVDALCTELSELLSNDARFGNTPRPAQSQSQSQSGGAGSGASLFVPGSGTGAAGSWWPEGLGAPGSVGAQNNLRYATFPQSNRLAIDLNGRVTLYDTGDHRINGFSQQQGGDQSLTFTSQHGTVRIADLPVVSGAAADGGHSTPPAPASAPSQPSPAVAAPSQVAAESGIFAMIERLADLRDKKILSDAEFEAKKAELLSRL